MELRFGPKVTEPIAELDEQGRAVQVMRTRHRWQARIIFRQVALWHDYKPIFDWLNPLIWYRKDGHVYLRRQPAEQAS